MKRHGHAFWMGARQALPIVAGYVPVGITFGMVAMESGMGGDAAAALSAFVFAGAAQFLVAGMYGDGMPVAAIAVLAGLINLRHAFYGAPVGRRLPPAPGMLRAVAAHSLTDEVFALALNKLEDIPSAGRWPWLLGAGVVAFLAWLGATLVGTTSAGALADLHPAVPDTLAFALPALFVMLLMPQIKGVMVPGAAATVLVAAGGAIAGLPNIAIVVAALVGVAIVWIVEPWTQA
jgi:4-azaleucine resistance transporter AzlC